MTSRGTVTCKFSEEENAKKSKAGERAIGTPSAGRLPAFSTHSPSHEISAHGYLMSLRFLPERKVREMDRMPGTFLQAQNPPGRRSVPDELPPIVFAITHRGVLRNG